MEDIQLIEITEIIVNHHLDHDFIEQLERCQLVEFVVKDNTRYVHNEQLPQLERIIRLHTDLEVNMEGIEVINHMLERMETLQDTIKKLQSRLHLYEE